MLSSPTVVQGPNGFGELGEVWQQDEDFYPYHPGIVYLYIYKWLIVKVNVGKYASPMDGIG